MAIFRSKTERYFAAIDSRVIRNSLLSLPALGLLAVLLDRPNTWKYRLVELARTLRLPDDRLQELFAELTEKGFAQENRDRYGVYYDLYSYPESPPVPFTSRAAPQAFASDGGSDAAKHGVPDAPPASRSAAGDEAPSAPQGTEPMTDEQREKWLCLIRERFPQTVKAHDLNDAIARR